MNHLAHALLAERAGVSVAGSFAGDFVHGRLDGAGLLGAFAPDLLEGVRFHRAVDSFTDAHPGVARAAARFGPPYRRWAGVLVDVWFDHLLARKWDAHHREPLEAFAARVADELRSRRGELPARSHPFLDFLLRENLLVAYREEEGAFRALEGMARRIPRVNPLGSASAAIRPLGAELEADFDAFFPEAAAMARAWGESGGAGYGAWGEERA